MGNLAALDPVLLRQLKRVGSADPASAPTSEAWTRFLTIVNDYYKHMNDDRTLLTRSIELSTTEMDEMRRRTEAQRDQLRAIVDAIGEALGMFGGIMQGEDGGGPSSVTGLEIAKREFSSRLDDIFKKGETDSDSSHVSGIQMNVVNLADQLIRLLSETAERASMKKELEVARVVQQLLVPAEDIITKKFVRIAGFYRPASECGGDWWAVYDLPEDRVLTLIGDVTGHGIASAIITGAAKAACDLACHITKGMLTPGDLLRMMNSAIHETARRQIMMTCTAGIYDGRNRSLTIANAGHPFPHYVHNGQLKPVVVQGQPLGASSGSNYEATTISFAPGDTMLWFTDGIVEAENTQGEQFSERRLRGVCQRAAPQGAAALRDAIVDAVDGHMRGRSQVDDMTLVVLSAT